MTPTRVLVFPCGTGIGLEIADALRHSKGVTLIGATSASREPDAGAVCFDEYYNSLPLIRSGDFAGAFAALARRCRATHVFPAYDDAVEALHALDTDGRLGGATLLAPPATMCAVVRSKALTYARLAGTAAVPVPTTWPPATWNAAPAGGGPSYPAFMKPERGEGSRGARVVRDAADAAAHATTIQDAMLCELLRGEELTVDCFSARPPPAGGNVSGARAAPVLLYVGARIRERVRAGMSVVTRVVPTPAPVLEMARALHAAFAPHGAWFFQVKYRLAEEGALGDTTPVLLEVAPRVGGASGVSRALGVNLPLLTLLEAQGHPIEIEATAPPPDGLRAVKTYTTRAVPCWLPWEDAPLLAACAAAATGGTIYVDLDDTLWRFPGDIRLRETASPSKSEVSSSEGLVVGGAGGRGGDGGAVDAEQTPSLNEDILGLLLRCAGHGGRIVAVTRRSAAGAAARLRRWRLTGVFDAVYAVDRERSAAKAEAIKRDLSRGGAGDGTRAGEVARGGLDDGRGGAASGFAVFIDDSFRERKRARDALSGLRVVTLDVDTAVAAARAAPFTVAPGAVAEAATAAAANTSSLLPPSPTVTSASVPSAGPLKPGDDTWELRDALRDPHTTGATESPFRCRSARADPCAR